MTSIIQTIQNRTFSSSSSTLPLSSSDPADKSLLRRRLSSLSLRLHPAVPSPAVLRRSSSSASAAAEYARSSLRRWWDWSWSWVLSRKPAFTKDLEMDEAETSALGSHCRGTLKHVFYKIRSEVRKLVGSDNVGLPQTYRYDSINYAKNFNSGRR
uniref:Uncharacterized protein n=1 Tax=Kalanchoe fedtschenkoi TaxID=63787 RepID=A0A7N0UWI8_KALFE